MVKQNISGMLTVRRQIQTEYRGGLTSIVSVLTLSLFRVCDTLVSDLRIVRVLFLEHMCIRCDAIVPCLIYFFRHLSFALFRRLFRRERLILQN